MKKAFLAIALALGLGTASAQTKGLDIERTEPITKPFDKITSIGSIDIEYTQGNKHSVKVIGKKHDVDKVKVTVNKGTLNVEVKSDSKQIGNVTVITAKLSDDVKIKVTSPELRGVKIVGSSDFTANSNIKTDRLNLDIAGSGEIDIKKVSAENLSASIAGSGEIDIENVAATCATANFSVAGSGDIEARLDGCKNVDCRVAGSGNIKMKGNVTNFSSSVAGSGNINTKELTVSGTNTQTTTQTTTRTTDLTLPTCTANGIIAEP